MAAAHGANHLPQGIELTGQQIVVMPPQNIAREKRKKCRPDARRSDSQAYHSHLAHVLSRLVEWLVVSPVGMESGFLEVSSSGQHGAAGLVPSGKANVMAGVAG